MAMTPRERFNMINQMLGRIEDDVAWPYVTVDTLLRQFGLPPLDMEWTTKQAEFSRIISDAPDEMLLGMYATVMDISDDDARSNVVKRETYDLWNDDQIRLFISHSAKEKKLAGEIAQELAVVGVHGFVAHETMKIAKPWQAQMETALRTAEAFVGLVHEPFNESLWCQQEIGWAKGRELPEYFIRLGGNPKAFAGSTQWPDLKSASAREIAMNIFGWLQQHTALTDRVEVGLIAALKNATDYVSAGAAAERVVALGKLSDDGWSALDEAYIENPQVYGGILSTRQLKPFYEAHSRALPLPF